MPPGADVYILDRSKSPEFPGKAASNDDVIDADAGSLLGGGSFQNLP